MPVVINSVEVSQEQPRPAGADGSAVEPAAPARPDPDEVRRLLERMSERMLRLLTH